MRSKKKKTGQRPGARYNITLITRLTAAYTGTGINGIDPEEERDPPPQPTVVTFPPDVYFEDAYWNEETPPPNLESLFSKVLRPNDVRDEHAVALNINVLAKCPLEKLVPPKPDGGSYLPSLDPEQTNDKPSYADAAKPESLDARRRSDFNTRLVELRIDNDLAFRTLNRTVKGEVKPPRLGHLRKFWEGLENMSRYWDCSLDDYYTHKVENDDWNSAKRQRVDGHPLTSADTAAPDASSPKSPTSAQGTVVDHDTDQTADNDQLSSERVVRASSERDICRAHRSSLAQIAGQHCHRSRSTTHAVQRPPHIHWKRNARQLSCRHCSWTIGSCCLDLSIVGFTSAGDATRAFQKPQSPCATDGSSLPPALG